jgi:anti-sigma regulatory factor (Ser/Thr protein kinase)
LQSLLAAMPTQEEKIIQLLRSRKQIKTQDVVGLLKVSRQYAKVLIDNLITNGKLMKLGSTRSAFYISPQYATEYLGSVPTIAKLTIRNRNVEEHKIIETIEDRLPLLLKLRENIKSIFTYAFSEMLNNAIEHSESKNIGVEVKIANKKLSFRVMDAGVGVFKNVMKKRGLKSEIESAQDLLKGKITTQPQAHSGEGIFFTSKVADLFLLDSYGQQLIVNNRIKDIFIKPTGKRRRGTVVSFEIDIDSEKHLNNVFKKYTDSNNEGGYGFDKTEIKIKLYIMGGVHVSRSQARRVLASLEKFKSIVFDFDKVPIVGQAFVDEIFRVFHNKYPDIKLQAINMNDPVRFMVERGKAGNTGNETGDLFNRN